LIKSLLVGLGKKGLKACVLKHAGHDLELDKGKDTWRFRRAGALASAVIDEGGLASFYIPSSTLESSLAMLESQNPDIILCEGFKDSTLPKIVILREEDEFGLLPSLESVLAVVYEGQPPSWVKVPVIHDKEGGKEVLRFLLEYLAGLKGART